MQGVEQVGGDGPTMPSGSVHPVTDGILVDIDDTAGTPQRMTFCQGPQRDGVIWFLRAHTEVRRALAHRKRALTPGAQQSRNAAIGSTKDQMRAKAALAVVCALWVRTGACGELHSSLLMRTVCRASGVYSGGPPFSLFQIHPRYRGTPPENACDVGNSGKPVTSKARHAHGNTTCRIGRFHPNLAKVDSDGCRGYPSSDRAVPHHHA